MASSFTLRFLTIAMCFCLFCHVIGLLPNVLCQPIFILFVPCCDCVPARSLVYCYCVFLSPVLPCSSSSLLGCLTYVLDMLGITLSACVLTSDNDSWIRSSKTYAYFTFFFRLSWLLCKRVSPKLKE